MPMLKYIAFIFCLFHSSSSASPTFFPTPAFQVLSSSYAVKNMYAFAQINDLGGVNTWGAANYGGDSSGVDHLLTDVRQIVHSDLAFAALQGDGSVFAWGHSLAIRGSEAYHTASNIVSLVGNEQAFAGVTSGGSIISFGSEAFGGDIQTSGFVEHINSGVMTIVASAGAFAALKNDGTVWAWGNQFAGGGVNSLSLSSLANVKQLAASRQQFCALKLSGEVIMWGNDKTTSSIAVPSGITSIIGGYNAFVGYTSSEGLVSWGAVPFGGDSGAVSGSLQSGVISVHNTVAAFVAIRVDQGTVTSWGDIRFGGSVGNLFQITNIVATNAAFTALTQEGGAIAWGDASSGGDMGRSNTGDIVSKLSSNVVTLVATDKAFAALTAGGSVVAWGHENFGGRVPVEWLDEDMFLQGVSELFVNRVAFTARMTNGQTLMWGRNLSIAANM